MTLYTATPQARFAHRFSEAIPLPNDSPPPRVRLTSDSLRPEKSEGANRDFVLHTGSRPHLGCADCRHCFRSHAHFAFSFCGDQPALGLMVIAAAT
jgi:hypothetical protein